MENGIKFDLMKEKPQLDIPTLNWAWDWIWRRNSLIKPTNERKRGQKQEMEYISGLLEWMANNEK